MYDALCRAAAANPKTLELLLEATARTAEAEPPSRFGPRFGARRARTSSCRILPSAGGDRPVDDSFVQSFETFRDTFDSELSGRIARRSTQTNEVGRCAVLYPVLAHLARSNGNRPLALLDFGASAGRTSGSMRIGTTTARLPSARRHPRAPRRSGVYFEVRAHQR